MTQKRLREALQWASSFLSKHGIEEPQFTAEYLIRSYLHWDRTRFVLELSSLLTEDEWIGIENWVQRAAAQEPIQYIVGKQDFYGREFQVRPGVLIPRPETELLIEQVLMVSDQLFEPYAALRVIDLGTGSGAIPITLALERPRWKIYTVDISTQAIAIAKDNAERFGVMDAVHYLHGDMRELDRLFPEAHLNGGDFDILVSNPPYIPTQDIEQLQPNVKEYEPRLALDGGEDGLLFYRSILAQIGDHLRSPGLIAFEVGIGQAEQVVQLMMQTGYIKETRILADFQGIDRIILGYS